MAVTSYDKENLSAQQQAGIAAATERWNEATARGDHDAAKAAHAQAEAIRNSAGYTSDASGKYSGSYSDSSDDSGGSSSGGSSRAQNGWSSGTFNGSVKQSGTYTAEQQAIINQMNANSTQWWMASSAAEQAELHRQNERLAQQLRDSGVSVDENAAAGSWSVDGRTTQQVVQSGYARTGAGAATPTVSPLTNRAPDLQATLDRWLAAAQEQARRQADYAVSQGVNELQRAEEDAKAQFQTQRNQIAATEAKASDNQALYNERRGDRGGIGAAQYDAIANTAAQNQLAVNQAQVKLSTDTARQIADLRAQGEFQKADALLSLSQTYLQQLISIQQWGAEFNLSVDQFNKQLEQWNNEFEVKVADLLGEYRGAQTLASQSLDLQRRAQSFDEEYKTAGLTGIFRGGRTLESRKMLADSGYALAASGVMPSESQRAALQELYGYDANAVDALVQTAKLAEQAKITPSRTQGDSSGEQKTSGISLTTAKEMAEAGHFTEESVEKLRAAGYSDAYLEDQYGYRPNSADSTDVKFGSGISTKAPAGFSRSEWDNVVYVVGRYLKNQQTAEALAYFDSVSERLNKEQWNTLAELFASYNVSAAPPVYY